MPIDSVSYRMQREREIGFELQMAMPEIRTLYRQGLSERVIAELIYDNRDLCNYLEFNRSLRLMEGAVRQALVGSRTKNNIYEPLYDGLIKWEEYTQLSKEHRQRAARKTNALGRSSFYDPQRLREIHALAFKKRGLTSWSEAEAQYAVGLQKQGVYQREIAVQLNNLFHNGKEIRSSAGVARKFDILGIKTRKMSN